MRHEANDAKDDKTSKDTGDTVTTGHNDGISEDIVVKIIVAGQCDYYSPGDSDGEKYLSTGISPDLIKYSQVMLEQNT